MPYEGRLYYFDEKGKVKEWRPTPTPWEHPETYSGKGPLNWLLIAEGKMELTLQKKQWWMVDLLGKKRSVSKECVAA